jgi:hypothetical protein
VEEYGEESGEESIKCLAQGKETLAGLGLTEFMTEWCEMKITSNQPKSSPNFNIPQFIIITPDFLEAKMNNVPN